MTDDEILEAALVIRKKRAQAKRGRTIFGAQCVEIRAWNGSGDLLDSLTVEPGAELAALLCKALGVELTYVALKPELVPDAGGRA